MLIRVWEMRVGMSVRENAYLLLARGSPLAEKDFTNGNNFEIIFLFVSLAQDKDQQRKGFLQFLHLYTQYIKVCKRTCILCKIPSKFNNKSHGDWQIIHVYKTNHNEMVQIACIT